MNASKRKLLQTPLAIAEDIKLQLMAKVDSFLISDEDSYTFPASLTKTERMFLHGYTVSKGILSQSTGDHNNRKLTISRPKSRGGKDIQTARLKLSGQSKKTLYRCFSTLPRTPDAKKEAASKNQKAPREADRRQFGMSTLTNGIACVPPVPQPLEQALDNQRKSLPIYESRQLIIDTIGQNQVVILVGETGSGKTTQVPQYLLEDATASSTNCRIICTQPRRLSALSVADRVAYERNEETGGTVGFQIRLESKTCPRSNLIYCTNGILVRCLMTGDHQETFRNITHIILDEVHERDKNADFLLITIRDALKLNPKLKLILMSATIDTSLFAQYFGNCPQIYVPGRTFQVQDLFLEDVLRLTKFKQNEVEMIFQKTKNSNKIHDVAAAAERKPTGKRNKKNKPTIRLDEETQEYVDSLLERCLKEDFQEDFDQFIFMVEAEEVSVDFQHSETQLTALMVAATRGCSEVVETLLSLEADAAIRTTHGLTALDLAVKMNHEDCAALLRNFQQKEDDLAPETPSKQNPMDSTEYVDVLLDVYNNSFNATVAVDRFLIIQLVEFIHHEMPMGSVLIFLPGYEDITTLNNMIMDKMNERQLKPNLRIYMLHSNMKVADQKAVFKPAPFGCRKIILSTNIAETSITIDDVVYVIDCGKVKQTNFDVHTGTNCLETVPISKACSKQRAGRAGRVTSGICYKMYSRKQYDWMAEFTVPELMRVPLTDICLAAKLISPRENIADFLAKAVTPPLKKCIQRSVELLKKIGALEEEGEVITNLGVVLADLPVDAHLGKMIIYAIILKCVDPVLTIVSALSVKSVFTLPPDKRGKDEARELKLNLDEGSFSDHLVLIRVFQKWLEYSSRRSADEFCRRHYLNAGSLQTICGMRSLILGHLRANRLIKSNGRGNIHDLNVNAKNWAVVKACLVAGLYPNVCARIKRSSRYFLRGEVQETIQMHNQSVLRTSNAGMGDLNALPADWIVFEEKVRSAGKGAAIDCNTVVTPATIALFAGSLSLGDEAIHWPEEEDSEDETEVRGKIGDQQPIVHMQVNKWITLEMEEESAVVLLEMRKLFNGLLMRMLNGHEQFHIKLDANDHLIIVTMAEVLLAEDKAAGMVQPKGIGDRPQAVHLDFSADINFGIQEAGSANGHANQVTREDQCPIASTSREMSRMTIGQEAAGPQKRNQNQWNGRGNNQKGGAGQEFMGRGGGQAMRGGGRGGGAQERGSHPNRGERANQGQQMGRQQIQQGEVKRFFLVRVETRNEAQMILHGSSFYPLEFLKRELNQAAKGPQVFVIFFNVATSRELFGCGLVDSRKRTGSRLVVEKVSAKSLWHSCYKGWTAEMSEEAMRELNAPEGEYLYTYFSSN